MRITGIIWLEEIIEKVEQKHAVKQVEVKQALANSPRFRFVEKVTGEARMFIPHWHRLIRVDT